MSLTGRPSRPPLALVSSSQIFIPSSACLPKPASGPVSAMPKPMVIGWLDGVCACVDFRDAATAATARREVAISRHFSRASMVSSLLDWFARLSGVLYVALTPSLVTRSLVTRSLVTRSLGQLRRLLDALPHRLGGAADRICRQVEPS